ncbi:MAG TPA: DUF4249 domain-containing protein [Bacteroidota bacterium]|nr:DUF4249 domain-containing protein [Bacteroidota bacterium]
MISVDLNESSPHIVIEGMISDSVGPHNVYLSMTENYFADSLYVPPVSHAIVIVSDNRNQQDTLKEISSGIYQTSTIQGIPGITYQLKVISNGVEYDATSSMPQKVYIDSLYSLVRTGFGGNTGYDIYITFKDPPQTVGYNYYRINIRTSAAISQDSIDGLRYRLYNDELTKGQEMTVRVRAGDKVNKGDTLTIELMSIDKATYDYFHTLANILSSDQSPTSLAPQNPLTNLSNGALGYFAAYTVDTRKIILQ